MTVKDAMRALGVFAMREPTPDKVQAVFKRLCLRHHPDKGGDPEKLKRVVAARQVVLSSWDVVAELHRQHWEKKAENVRGAIGNESISDKVARVTMFMDAFNTMFADFEKSK